MTTQMNFNDDFSIDGAARCHICFRAPVRTFEPPVFGYPIRSLDVVLRCPLDHGNIAVGHTTRLAVELWNAYIEYRMRTVNQLKAAAANPDGHVVLSPCKQCLNHTRSILHTEGTRIIEECTDCHLTKSLKEVD